MRTDTFEHRLEQFAKRPELQRVFDEAKRLAKDDSTKERIEDVRAALARSPKPARRVRANATRVD